MIPRPIGRPAKQQQRKILNSRRTGRQAEGKTGHVAAEREYVVARLEICYHIAGDSPAVQVARTPGKRL